MNEMIERVARAICALQVCELSCCPDDGKTCRGTLNDWQLDQARAAISAMRDPTSAMIDAADVALSAWRKTLDRDEAMARSYQAHDRRFIASATPTEKHAIRFRAMIDAAVAQGPRPEPPELG